MKKRNRTFVKAHNKNKFFYATLLSVIGIVILVTLAVFILSLKPPVPEAEVSSLVGQASFFSLNPEQKQFFWKCWKGECSSVYQEAKATKNYQDYRVCSLRCFDEAEDFVAATCSDPNDNDYLTKSKVTSDLYPTGKEDYCYTFPNGKTYLFEGICKDNKYQYIQKNCAELGSTHVCEEGRCVSKNYVIIGQNNPLPDFKEPYIPEYPYLNEVEIEPVYLSNGNITVIVPQGYEAYGEKHLEDLQYCFNLIPDFVGINSYFKGIVVKIYISKDNTNSGNYWGGVIHYRRSQWNMDDDLSDVLTNNPKGFLYHSSPTYCANSHEFTHYVVDYADAVFPGWANEGISEYTQKTTQKGSKDHFECQESGWYGQDGWGDNQFKLFPYSDLSGSWWTENGAYRSPLCFWELFDNKFGAEKRRETFQLLREQYTAEFFEYILEEDAYIYQLKDGTLIKIPNIHKFYIENVLFPVVNPAELKPLLQKFGFEEGTDFEIN